MQAMTYNRLAVMLASCSTMVVARAAPRSRLSGVPAGSQTTRMPRSPRPNVSAGLLLFRRSDAGLELFIAHPGGPFWKDRDAGAWTIPKGIVESGEDLLDAARREFEEETSIRPLGPFIPLGSIRQKAGKTIHAWAWEGDANATTVVS